MIKVFITLVLSIFLFSCSINKGESKDLELLKNVFFDIKKSKIDFKEIVQDIEWDYVRFISSHYPTNPIIDDIDIRDFKVGIEDYKNDENLCYIVFYKNSKIKGHIDVDLFSFENLNKNFFPSYGTFIIDKKNKLNKKEAVFLKKKDSIINSNGGYHNVDVYTLGNIPPRVTYNRYSGALL